MTVRKVITLVRDLTQTPLSDAVLLQFLSECENSILTDKYLASPEDCLEYEQITDATLLIPHPFDKLYLPYLQAKVYYEAGEFGQYQNYMALYNEYLDDFAVYLLSEVHPGNGRALENG
jgi:hypothetical protein